MAQTSLQVCTSYPCTVRLLSMTEAWQQWFLSSIYAVRCIKRGAEMELVMVLHALHTEC